MSPSSVPGFVRDERTIVPAFCLYGNWCGPGCSGPGPPIDDLDRCCQIHDTCYDARGWGACSCDRDLMGCVWPKINPWTAKGRTALVVWWYFAHGWCNPFP
jgi:hypothetical protein